MILFAAAGRAPRRRINVRARKGDRTGVEDNVSRIMSAGTDEIAVGSLIRRISAPHRRGFLCRRT